MEILSMACLQDLTDDSIMRFASRCVNVKTMNLTGLPNLSDANFVLILKHQNCIENIIVNLCPLILDKNMKEIYELYPNVNIVRKIQKYTSAEDSGLRMNLPKKNARRPGDKPKKKGKK